MKILNPNTGENNVLINRNNTFVSVSDYGSISVLKEIIISPGQHHWEWIGLFTQGKIYSIPINISDIGNRFSSFNNAINKEINNPYSTVYEFDNFLAMAKNIADIKYIDPITTIYRAEE